MKRPRIDRKRLFAVLALRDCDLKGLSFALECTQPHLWYVTTGARPLTRRIERGLQAFLGEDAWRWVIGETDTYCDARQASTPPAA